MADLTTRLHQQSPGLLGGLLGGGGPGNSAGGGGGGLLGGGAGGGGNPLLKAAMAGITAFAAEQMANCGSIRTGQPLCLIGDSNTGKSHLLIGLGTAAAENGFRVNYTLATKLVNELVRPRTTRSWPRRSPATAVLICFAFLSLATWNSTSVVLSYFSTF